MWVPRDVSLQYQPLLGVWAFCAGFPDLCWFPGCGTFGLFVIEMQKIHGNAT